MTASGDRSDEAVDYGDDLVEVATAWFVRMRSDLVTGTDRHDFQAWLARDPAHRDAYAEAEALWGEIGAMPDPRAAPEAQPDAAEERGTVLDFRDRRAPYRRAPRGLRYGAVAASVALIGWVTLWSVGGYDGLRADHRTEVGETRTVTLPDGSTAELNTDTAIAVAFSERHRRIELFRGEAFFTVAKDETRPFDVIAGSGTSRAVGTAFDVLDADGTVTVIVDEGTVQVSRQPDADDADSVLLHQGDTATYARMGDIDVSRIEVGTATAWRQGRLVFANWRLRDVVQEIDRYRPGAITLLGSQIAEERFTGVFNLADTDRALDAIESTLAVDVVRITPYLTVLRARD